MNTSKTAVAALMRVAWRSVGTILERVAAEASRKVDLLDGLRRIGIDEISHRKGQRYLTVVVDHDTGRLVWAAPGRDRRTVLAFFDALGEERCQHVELVSADMAAWISGPIAERVPHAVRCVDPFHVVMLATDALDDVRREVWNDAVLGAVAVTAIPKIELTLPREHAVAAARAGGRYVLNSPALLALIARAIAFIFPAGAIWALLPLVARHRLGLGSAGYGLLLGCVGVGALAAATFGPSLRQRLAPRAVYGLACLILAGAALALSQTHAIVVAVVALTAAGGAWIVGLGLLGAAYQGELPRWVKARGVSYYLVAFQGANAIGALVLGGVAQADSVATALIVVGVLLLVASVATWRLALPAGTAPSVLSEQPLPLPDIDGSVEEGPVVIAVAYPLAPGNADAFLAQTAELRRSRRRTGAIHWHLHRDLADPDLFEETFVVGSWEEHERQHQRLAGHERAVLDTIDTLLAEGHSRVARHLLGVRPPREPQR